MATIRKHKKKWQALVRRVGHKPIIKSFISKTASKKWARDMERKLDQGDYSDYNEANKLTLGDLFNCFIREEKHKKRKRPLYGYRCKILCKDTIADTNLLRLSSRHLAEFRDRKRKEVGPSTYNKYLIFD